MKLRRLTVLALVTATLLVAVLFSSSNVEINATPTKVVATTTTPTFELPMRIDIDQSERVPFGYERVTVHIKSPEKAKALWLKANNGSMEGYSFEKANQITLVSRIGTAPCACHLEAFPFVYYGKTKEGTPDCRDEC